MLATIHEKYPMPNQSGPTMTGITPTCGKSNPTSK